MRCKRGMLTTAATFFALALSAGAAAPAAATPRGVPGPYTAAAGNCTSLPQAGGSARDIPWAQKWLAPERAWNFSNGAGITVAVIDSGVQANTEHLNGKVDVGWDFFKKVPGGNFDCVGHGTGVASIIAGQRREGFGFQGIAPGARILPIRVSEKQLDDEGIASGKTVSMAELAQAIDYAVAQKARVINMSFILGTDDPAVRNAVKNAIAKGVVVVAAAGNQHAQGKDSVTPDDAVYPAAYPDVIGVGAMDWTGARVKESQVGNYVDLMAPGSKVLCQAAGGGYQQADGTSFATPFVSGTAALMLAREPNLSPKEVSLRLFASASSTNGGAYSMSYGHGVVDPYRAVTERRVTGSPVAPKEMPAPVVDKAAQEREAREAETRQWAFSLAAGGGALAGVVLAGAAILPRGRRRRWFPGRTKPFYVRPEVEEASEAFFTPPAPPSPSGTERPR